MSETQGKKRGRKKLVLADPNVFPTLIQNLSLGATARDACAHAGISEPTYYEYLAIAEAITEDKPHPRKPRHKVDQQVYVDFAEAVKKARAEARINALVVINNAALKEWQAAAWLLERTDPDNWGRKVVDNRHSGAGGGPVRIEWVSPLSDNDELGVTSDDLTADDDA